MPTSVRHRLHIARHLAWRLTHTPLAIAYRRYEDREVGRIKGSSEPFPTAMVATIIATYRRPEGLLAAVRSALAQTITDHLVVVVDDGGGLPVLPDDPRLVSVSLSRNYGCLGMVRNVGLRATRSEFVAFLDDDNTWTPDHLAISLDAHRAGASITYTALLRVLPDGTLFDIFSVPFDRTVRWRNPVDSNALVLRRRPEVIFSRIPKLKEDHELIWRLSRRQEVVHVPVPTVRYLVNASSYYTNWTDTLCNRDQLPAASPVAASPVVDGGR